MNLKKLIFYLSIQEFLRSKLFLTQGIFEGDSIQFFETKECKLIEKRIFRGRQVIDFNFTYYPTETF